MKFWTIKPISYVKANAAAPIRELAEKRQPLVITQNGKATAVMQDVASYEQTQETLALLKILALGNRQISEGRVVPAAEVLAACAAKRRGANAFEVPKANPPLAALAPPFTGGRGRGRFSEVWSWQTSMFCRNRERVWHAR